MRMPASTTLLISADPSLIKSVEGVVASVDHLRLEVVSEIDDASDPLSQEGLVLVLAHLTAGQDTDEVASLLQSITAMRLPVATLVLAEEYRAEEALALLRLGAADFLSRPLDLNRLGYLVDVLTVRARMAGPSAAPVAAPAPPPAAADASALLSPHSPAMAQLMGQVRKVAPQDTTVLLHGETGTGKTRLARLLHELSPRRNEPFLVIDCGALSGNLIESEMFGHVKGAFTGADRARTGKFADVGGGTLLLDEIDALSLLLQTKLLRAVDERVFEPVGSNKSQPVRARLVVASNRSLEQEAAAGRFRADLYYRLNVVALSLPPLRDRPSAIQPMAEQFIAEFA